MLPLTLTACLVYDILEDTALTYSQCLEAYPNLHHNGYVSNPSSNLNRTLIIPTALILTSKPKITPGWSKRPQKHC